MSRDCFGLALLDETGTDRDGHDLAAAVDRDNGAGGSIAFGEDDAEVVRVASLHDRHRQTGGLEFGSHRHDRVGGVLRIATHVQTEFAPDGRRGR